MRPYPAYKDSGVEWLGAVPEGWEILRLKQSIATCRNGIWGDDPETTDDPIICVRVADFDRQALAVRIDEPTLRAVTESERQSRLLHPGNLLLEKSGGGEGQPVGAVVLFNDEVPAVCSNFVARIELAKNMHPNFWLYAHRMLYDVRVNVRSIKQTSGIQNLDQSAYFDEIFAFPPFPEQQAIARFLDKEVAKIDALVAEQRRLIALLAEKRQAVISHAVTKGLNPATHLKPSGIDWLGDIPEGWEVVPLKYLGNFGAGAGFPHDQQGLEGEELPFFKVNALGKAGPDGVLIPDTDTISRETANRLRATIFPSGTIVFAKIGAALLLGRIRTLPCASCIDNNMMALTVSGEHCTAFVKLAMSTLHFDLISNPGTVPSLNEGQIADQRIALPPMTEQIAIAEYISQTAAQLDALTSAAQSAISLLQERRAALISAAVTGKIDLRPHFAQSLSEPEIA